MSQTKLKKAALGAMALAALTVLPEGAHAQTANVAYTYHTVPIGALGSNFGGVVHPKDGGVVYFRGDGGAYRWDGPNSRWVSISNGLPARFDDYYVNSDVKFKGGSGVAALAVDPSDASANLVYMASNNDIWKSTDRGVTWTEMMLQTASGGIVSTNDNGDGRWLGRRLAVDPNDGGTLFYVSNNDGLFRYGATASGGSAWVHVAGFSFNGSPGAGLSFVDLDKRGGTITINGHAVSRVVYVGVCGGSDNGVYRSVDGGQNWAKLGVASGLTLGQVNMGEVAPDGTLYVTYGGGVAKCASGASVLADCTPAGQAGNYFQALAVAASDSSGKTLLAGMNGNWDGNPIYRSADGGLTWQSITNWNAANSNLLFNKATFSRNLGWFAINPHDANDIWMGDNIQVFHTANAFAANGAQVVWTDPIEGFEGGTFEAKPVCPPSGAPVFTLNEDGGIFRIGDITQHPKNSIGPWADGSGLDYCEADPNFIAFAGSNTGSGNGAGSGGGLGLSRDNGQTYPAGIGLSAQDLADFGGRVAVGSTKAGRDAQGNPVPIVIHYPEKASSGPRVSTDWGASWKSVSGLPSGLIGWYYDLHSFLAADKVNGQKFYLIAGTYGAGSQNRLYYSTDGGAHFQSNWSQSLGWNHGENGDVMALPGHEGEIYFNLVDSNNTPQTEDGLFHATQADTASPRVTRVAGVLKAYSFSLGCPAPGRRNMALYVFGIMKTGQTTRFGLFRSDDATSSASADLSDAHWVCIYDPNTDQTARGALYLGNTNLQADRQTYGRVYVNIAGRGLWVGNPTAPSANIAVGTTVSLKALANNQYVCADLWQGANPALVSNRTAVGTWEEFQVVDAGNGAVALKALANGLYVHVDPANVWTAPLTASASALGVNESFLPVDAGGGNIALKSVATGTYVCADLNISSQPALYADRTAVGGWETFTPATH